MLSKRFPFGIYYEVENDVAYVYAILREREAIYRNSKETCGMDSTVRQSKVL